LSKAVRTLVERGWFAYQSFIARLERVQRRLDIVELVKLGKVLGFDPTDIVSRLVKMKD
jgi:hypothetical protein